jgi:hypothetical protein
MTKNIFNETSADKQQIGFEYQDFVCLEYLIDLKPGESVGLEVFDDVHHERISGEKSLIQVKHSVSEDSSITNLDLDLWKTLCIWSKALDELNSNKIELIFFTNKKKTEKKGLVQLIDSTDIDLQQIRLEISAIKSESDIKDKGKLNKAKTDSKYTYKVNPIKKYIDYIDDLNEAKISSLFTKINMIFSSEDILNRLAQKIEYFTVPKSEAIDVVHYLLGAFKTEKYKLIKGNTKINIDYKSFRQNFQFDRIIQITQDRKIDFSRYHSFKTVNQIDPKSGVFSKQLSDINIPSNEITDYAIEYAATSMYIQKLISEGKLSEVENTTINTQVFNQWKRTYRSIFSDIKIDLSNDNVHKSIARKCLYKVLEITVQVSNSTLDASMIEGKAMELSDQLKIGWRQDWNEKYGCNI